LQKTVEEKEDVEKLDRLMSSVRNAMYAAKNIKDAIPDIVQLRNSSNDIKYGFYMQTLGSVNIFCERIYRLLAGNHSLYFEELAAIYKSVTDGYTTTLQQLYREGIAGQVSETEITTLLNFNREIFTAFKSLFFGLKDYLLDKEQSKYFDDLPGFIR
jgi:phosphate:Na+ symporter